jgi:hypothetical protein
MKPATPAAAAFILASAAAGAGLMFFLRGYSEAAIASAFNVFSLLVVLTLIIKKASGE